MSIARFRFHPIGWASLSHERDFIRAWASKVRHIGLITIYICNACIHISQTPENIKSRKAHVVRSHSALLRDEPNHTNRTHTHTHSNEMQKSERREVFVTRAHTHIIYKTAIVIGSRDRKMISLNVCFNNPLIRVLIVFVPIY